MRINNRLIIIKVQALFRHLRCQWEQLHQVATVPIPSFLRVFNIIATLNFYTRIYYHQESS